MPYIRQEDRKTMDGAIDGIPVGSASPGMLNYVVTRIVNLWISAWGESYTTLNAAVGVLECVKQELYRRRVAAYEDRKIAENGDVY